jgi:hypothetical protein
MKVAVFGNGRSDSREVRIAQAMAAGAKRHGHEVVELSKVTDKMPGDLLISYGWVHELTHKMFSKYRASGRHYVFVDLGYWNRSQTGHHRIAVDDWDSLGSLRTMPDDRLGKSQPGPLRESWNSQSKEVMVAGMSAKAARSHGYRDQQWENQTLRHMQNTFPDYNIYLRPKPRKNSPHFGKLPRIVDAVNASRLVASHHSNVSVDCLWAGVPYFCEKGVGKWLSIDDLSRDEVLRALPPSTSVRRGLLASIAYVQYDLKEMAEGVCFDYIKGILE